MRAVTDADGEVRADEQAKPGVTNLLRMYSALAGESVESLERRYAGQGYGTFKKDLAEVVVGALSPVRERTEKLLANETELDALLAAGAARARDQARRTMTAVMDKVGFLSAWLTGLAWPGARLRSAQAWLRRRRTRAALPRPIAAMATTPAPIARPACNPPPPAEPASAWLPGAGDFPSPAAGR